MRYRLKTSFFTIRADREPHRLALVAHHWCRRVERLQAAQAEPAQ